MLKTAALLLVLSAVAMAQAPASRWGAPEEPIVKQIIADERAWAELACGPQQLDFIADDFQGTAPSGQRYGREVATRMPKSPDTDCRLGTVKVHFFGADLAIAYGAESSVRNRAPHCLVWTDTWLKRNGRWQIISAQDNRGKCE